MKIIENKLKFGNMSIRKKTARLILHHAEAKTCTVEDIHRWHKERGWSGMGYHFLVRKDGKIYRGRPENTVGSHALNNNSDSIGICFEGSYMKETMPEKQVQSGRELVAYLKEKYGISKVQKHKDVCSTSCPGTKFPFREITGGTSVSKTEVSEKRKPIPKTKKDSWIEKLQKECNRQKFSSQIVDGIAGKNTLAGCPTVRKGAKGEITKLLQQKLIELGYSCGTSGADGKFGKDTYKAVCKYQKNHGLPVDGIVGQKTWGQLIGM